MLINIIKAALVFSIFFGVIRYVIAPLIMGKPLFPIFKPLNTKEEINTKNVPKK
jgi:hypothetical protein